MKSKFIVLAITFSAILFCNSLQAQDVRPFRIGLKLGTPILVGGAIEYVLPVANNRIGINADLGSFNFSSSGNTARYTYFSVGGNFYLNKKGIGRGPYVGLSYGNLGFKFDYTGLTSTSGTGVGGTASTKLNISQVQIRLGLKTGKGAFYFCPEIGYGFSSIPSSVKIDITYSNGTKESRSEDISGVPSSALSLVASMTFGFTF